MRFPLLLTKKHVILQTGKMKIVKHTILIFLSALFIVSSCGIFLTLHECASCDISEVYLNSDNHTHEHCKKLSADHDCCSESTCETEYTQEENCCSESSCETEYTHLENCCRDENVYFKLTEEYIYSVQKLVPETNFITYNVEYPRLKSLPDKVNPPRYNIIKPPDDAGRDLLLNISVLIL